MISKPTTVKELLDLRFDQGIRPPMTMVDKLIGGEFKRETRVLPIILQERAELQKQKAKKILNEIYESALSEYD